MGRPSLFTEERAEQILRTIERCGFQHIAAEINGIHRTTLAAWLERGDAGEEPFAEFAVKYRSAHARWQEKRLEGVRDDKWQLEKAEQSVFASKQSVELSGNVGLELAQLEGMSTEQIKQALRQVLDEGDKSP